MSEKHYVNEIGTEIILDCGEDITNASVMKMAVEKPDGSHVEWNASLYTLLGRPNYLRYVTITGDLSLPGRYEVQAIITKNGWIGRGETAEFVVYENFS